MIRVKTSAHPHQPIAGPLPTRDKMDHIQLINLFIRKRGYKRYLEIGCFADTCFNQIQADVKVGVDPASGGTVRMTSDEYFAQAIAEGTKFDLIFIDGLHHHDQVYRDIINALECLAPGGCIMMHDCLPPDRNHETAENGEVQFCGTCWRAFAMIRERTDLDAITGDFDYGVGLIRRVPNPLPIKIGKTMDELTYADFTANREAWMRPLDPMVFDIIADRPWGPPSLALMVIGKSDEEIEAFKAGSPHVEQEARVVYVSNPGRRHGATAAIANPFIEAATEDVVAIVHADTAFAPGALGVFSAAAVDHNCLTGIVGRVEYVDGDPGMGYTWCTGAGGVVSTLDSCSVFMRRSLGLRFDGATFDDFHCVVEDLCLQARALGVRAYVPPAAASHVGTATEATWNDSFWRYRQKLLDKYPGQVIHTV
jgi:hypothetical protein